MNQIEFLKKLYQDHGDFRISYKNGDYVKKWVLFSQSTTQEQEKCNLRELVKDEVVLDVEDKESYENISKTLQTMKFSFSLWDTGSKGVHFHLFFPELLGDNFSIEKVKKVREWFIKKFKTDIQKKTGVIALENALHHKKTGKRKTLMYDYVSNEVNLIPSDCLEYIQQQSNTIPITYQSPITECRLIEYSTKNKLKEGSGRGNSFFKNCSIYLLNKYGLDHSKQILKQIYDIQKISFNDGWLRWSVTNKKNEFSCAELRKWLRDTQQEDVEQKTCWKCRWKK